ncbi:hypothetical protein J7E62_32365 [Variovorax paradoxus]|nr:hypothetical protein [Variovorax paradoxus]
MLQVIAQPEFSAFAAKNGGYVAAGEIGAKSASLIDSERERFLPLLKQQGLVKH